MNRTLNSSKNLFFGFINKVICLILPFFLRTLIINYLGVEYVGLNSLFTSLLNMLNLAELGISSAIVFSMYSAIAKKDTVLISALINVYKKVYRIIGIIVLVLGLAISPFLNYLISGDVPSDINLYILYYIYLGQTVLTYFLFAYKSCLFTAHQRADVISNVSTIVFLIQYILQGVVVFFFKNYYVYALFLPATTILNNIVIAILSKKYYPDYEPRGTLDEFNAQQIKSKVKSLFLYKVGSVVLTSVDSIVISAFLGLAVLGRYNNYYYVITALFGFLQVYYNAIAASIGNSIVVETKEKNQKDFNRLFLVQAWIVSWCSTCLFCLYQPFMNMWVGSEMQFSDGVVLCFAVYFFVWKIMDIINVYKDAAGLWEYDKFRPLVASIVNLALNILLVQFIGIYGILLSTIISIIFVIFPWSTYILFKHLFNTNVKKDWLIFIVRVVITFIVCVGVTALTYLVSTIVTRNDFIGLILKALICISIPNLLYLICFSFFKDFKETKDWVFSKFRLLFKKK